MCNKLQIKRVKIMNVTVVKFIYPSSRSFQFKTRWQGQNIIYFPRNISNTQQLFKELQWFKAQLAKDFFLAKFEVDMYSQEAAKYAGTKTYLTLQPEKEQNYENARR